MRSLRYSICFSIAWHHQRNRQAHFLSINMSTRSAAEEIILQKQSLRKEVRAKLRSISHDDIKVQSQQVWDRLFQLPAYQNAQSIGLFLSMPHGEINTDAALVQSVKDNKKVFVPQVGQNFELPDMELLRVVLDDATYKNDTPFHLTWPRNKWGIPEPPESMPLEPAQPGDIDLLIVPGLAFDRYGNRLGQGKGYYDRFITRMSSGNTRAPTLIAVALECQIVESVPVQDYDRGVDLVLIPSRMINAQNHAT